jgi:hypothetical protein
MVDLPYDPQDPPEEPPAGVDRLLWSVAFQLRQAHPADSVGFCQAPRCRRDFVPWPCEHVHLAHAALLGSVGWWTLPRQPPHGGAVR